MLNLTRGRASGTHTFLICPARPESRAGPELREGMGGPAALPAAPRPYPDRTRRRTAGRSRTTAGATPVPPVPSGAAPGGQSRRRTAPTARRKGHGRCHRAPRPWCRAQRGRGAPAAHSHLGSPATRRTTAGGRRRRDTAPAAPVRAAAASPAGAARTTPSPPPPPGHRGPGVFAPRCPTLPCPALPAPCAGGRGTSCLAARRAGPPSSPAAHRRAPRRRCPPCPLRVPTDGHPLLLPPASTPGDTSVLNECPRQFPL